jgi:hypothetical protein
MRPDELRQADEAAVARAETLLGRPLPAFLRTFAIEIGAVFLGGYASEGTEIASAVPMLVDEEGAAMYMPLQTIPLPAGLNELEAGIEDGFDDMLLPVLEDPYSAVGISGGEPMCIVLDPDNPDSTLMDAELDPEPPYVTDFESYVRRCLHNGGFYQLPDDSEEQAEFFRNLGRGLGAP